MLRDTNPADASVFRGRFHVLASPACHHPWLFFLCNCLFAARHLEDAYVCIVAGLFSFLDSHLSSDISAFPRPGLVFFRFFAQRCFVGCRPEVTLLTAIVFFLDRTLQYGGALSSMPSPCFVVVVVVCCCRAPLLPFVLQQE